MDADKRRCLSDDEITEMVIGAAYKVANTLGLGFSEKVYENALFHELKKYDLRVEQQFSINVIYDEVNVGDFFVDLFVEKRIVIELKYTKGIDDAHLAQCVNYLKATQSTLALLINFGTPRVQVKRVVLNHQ
ncbi:MAG: GxxExxY protein [Desulfobulbaceae bacterium]|nr:GxxExxY protein [Desulfobulbaceae bacterium]